MNRGVKKNKKIFWYCRNDIEYKLLLKCDKMLNIRSLNKRKELSKKNINLNKRNRNQIFLLRNNRKQKNN
jgi:hypothetical protein